MRRLFIAFICAVGLAAAVEVNAQEQPEYCDVCSNEYNTEIGIWTHAFQILGGGVFLDSSCTGGPFYDNAACHRTIWDQTCSYRHDDCEWQAAVESLASALKQKNTSLLRTVLTSSTVYQQRTDGSGYAVRSCDGWYVAHLSLEGETEVFLAKKTVTEQ